MSFFKGIRGKAVVPDKKEKTVKKPLKSVKMTKVSSSTEDRDTHYDDEKKKGEVSLCIDFHFKRSTYFQFIYFVLI